jgi:hypothetical protein
MNMNMNPLFIFALILFIFCASIVFLFRLKLRYSITVLPPIMAAQVMYADSLCELFIYSMEFMNIVNMNIEHIHIDIFTIIREYIPLFIFLSEPYSYIQ